MTTRLPTPAGVTLHRRGQGIVVSAAFPTAAHIAEAAVAGVTLLAGFLVAVLLGQIHAGSTPLDPRLAFAGMPIAIGLCVIGWLRLRTILPYRLYLDLDGAAAEGPRGVPLSVPEGDQGSVITRRMSLPWNDVEEVQLGGDGLVLRGRRPGPLRSAPTLLVPCRYVRPFGLLPAALRLSGAGSARITYPAFRMQELLWLQGLIARLRQSQAAALMDLDGDLDGPSPTLPEEERFFVVRALGGGRLHLVVAAAAAIAAAAVAWRVL